MYKLTFFGLINNYWSRNRLNYRDIFYTRSLSFDHYCQFLSHEITRMWNGRKLISSASLGFVLLSSISRRLFATSSGADPTLSNDSAKIRSGNGANPTPVHESERAPRALVPASLQDVLSISAPAPSYTISGARWNIAFKSNQDYSRIASPVGGCTARASDCCTSARPLRARNPAASP